mmetsp:Transcript_72853/g.202043  ORF Transcript_72853/g.202043 Transcript_72853/m.202043 type:complete len:458 (-) Transcript_72853:234-1607(-)
MNLDDASPMGAGHVRGPGVVTGSMGWLRAGFILYAFAAPSAVMAVPYAIGMSGLVGGPLICLVITAASIGGASMLLRIKLLFSDCHTLGDLGLRILGRPGQLWGNAIQLGNFCLFMPCALQFCAQALEGIQYGIPAFDGCNDYYVFVIALICLLTTQMRTFSNTQVLSCVSVFCVFAMMAIMVVAAFRYEAEDKVPAQWFGNPESDVAIGFVKAAGGFTINAWAFVPAFLTVELTGCMRNPSDFHKSLLLSGALNVAAFWIVGTIVVAKWGYDVGEVIGITSGVAAWKPGSPLNTAFNVFQLAGNFVSYMLDSVPLGRFCQKAWNPAFKDTWSGADIGRYFGYTLPTFLFALFLSVAVPSVNTLLDFTTALTTPWVTQIYPAVLYWKLFRNGHPALLQAEPQREMKLAEKFGVAAVFTVGCINFAICSVKAVGYISYAELRPPLQIGCGSWLIWTNS